MTSPTGDLSRELDTAVAAVRRAWEAIEPLYHGEYDIRQKPDGPVTEADHAANDIILDALRTTFPGDAILSEETAPDPARLGAERVWIVDPIDGTRDFIDKSGHFAIQIGLAVRTDIGHRPVVGVVYHPVADHLFAARKGGGAWLQEGRDAPLPLHASDTDTPPEMTAVFTRSHRTQRFLDLMDSLAPAHRISIGSIGLKIAWVASGRADYYLNNARGMCNEWDTCAPETILNEAGGLLTHLESPDPILYNQPDPTVGGGILATNNHRHEALRTRILATEAEIRSKT